MAALEMLRLNSESLKVGKSKAVSIKLYQVVSLWLKQLLPRIWKPLL